MRRDSKIITILIWNTLTVRQKTLKDMYRWICLCHQDEFPALPSYPTFVAHCHRIMPMLWTILKQRMVTDAPLVFMDSTMIKVCNGIAPPHFKQNKKMLTGWQHLLLTMRPKIESVFDYLKEHLHLVPSFPRSVHGYLLHYLRILLGYQMLVV